MVPIYPVLSLEFPVALIAVLMGERDPVLALQAAISPQVDEVLDRAEVLLQAGDVSAQASKNQTSVDPHTRSRHEIEVRGVEPLRIARTVSNPDQLAGVGVDPGVVRTPEIQGVPPLLPANGIGPMPADIEEHADVTVLAPRDDNGLGADPARTVVAWVRDLALVSNVDPRRLEELAHFLLVEQRISIHACVHAEVRGLLLHQSGTRPLC